MKRRPAVVFPADTPPATLTETRRRLLADWCIQVGQQLLGKPAIVAPRPRDPLEGIDLSRRARQVLTCLLVGDSEKQVALKLRVSPHTVHDYVKLLHVTLGVSSRSELMAKFISSQIATSVCGEAGERHSEP